MALLAREQKASSIRHMLFLELSVASLLPVAALLLLAVIGTRFIPANQAGIFIVIFALCVIVTFAGVFLIIVQMQHTIKKRLLTLINVCQDYNAGNDSAHAPVYGRDEFALLAIEINKTFERSQQQMWTGQNMATEVPVQQSGQEQDVADPRLRMQLEQVLQEISPALRGDLRVRARVHGEEVGTVADAVNYLIEELAHVIKQIRAASKHILSSTQDLLDRSIDLAQTTESQMQLLLQATGQVEHVVAFTQRLTGALTISAEASSTIQTYLSREERILQALGERITDVQQVSAVLMNFSEAEMNERPAAQTVQIYSHLKEVVQEIQELFEEIYMVEDDINEEAEETKNTNRREPVLFQNIQEELQRQLQLLKTVEQSTEEKASIAEEVVGELHTLAQRVHQASMGVLNAAERISSLAVIANEWQTSTAKLLLPGDDPLANMEVQQDNRNLGPFTPFHVTR